MTQSKSNTARMGRPRDTSYRRDGLWLSAMIHRLSGLALAIFLPVHFLFLGLAIRGEAELQSALSWTDNPLVKIAEMGLVFLLAVHLLGGIRVLVVENLPWHNHQKQVAFTGITVAAIIAFWFLVRVL